MFCPDCTDKDACDVAMGCLGGYVWPWESGPLLTALKTAEQQLSEAGHDGKHNDSACRALLTIRTAIAKATGSRS